MTPFPDSMRQLTAFLVRRRLALLFVLAAGFGLLAVFGVRGYLAERLAIEKARLAPMQATIDVVVARHDLEAGVSVDASNMAVRAVPADFVPGDVVLPDGFAGHAGARLSRPMRGGEPLLSTSLLGSDKTTFSSRIRPGIRAMSVLVDEVNSVSGMLQPGDRIDLLFSVRPPDAADGQRAQEVTATLLQNVEVLATGRQVRVETATAPGADARRHFTAITVEVTPLQAQQLIVAQRTGKLTAMLRNPDDLQPLPARAMDLDALLGIERSAPAVALVAPRGPEVIVGGRGTISVSAPARAARSVPVLAGSRRSVPEVHEMPIEPDTGEPIAMNSASPRTPGQDHGWRLRGFARAPTEAPDRLFADKAAGRPGRGASGAFDGEFAGASDGRAIRPGPVPGAGSEVQR